MHYNLCLSQIEMFFTKLRILMGRDILGPNPALPTLGAEMFFTKLRVLMGRAISDPNPALPTSVSVVSHCLEFKPLFDPIR